MTRAIWNDGCDGPRNGEFGDWHQVLTIDSVPAPDAPWFPTLCDFALSFDGYAALGDFDRLGTLANAVSESWQKTGELPDSLVELRACLFFEQRRQRWLDQAPGEFPAQGPWLAYVRALVDAIRLRAGEPPPSRGVGST